jgi:hypothetical protein
MATSLYDLSVPTFLQTISAIAGFLDRAAKHCAETSTDPNDFVDARLIDDMAPFHFQIEAAWHHAVWGVEALKTGAFTPPPRVIALQNRARRLLRYASSQPARLNLPRREPFVVSVCIALIAMWRRTARLWGPLPNRVLS